MRPALAAALALLLLLAACGGDPAPSEPAPGTPENPLVAGTEGGAATGEPGAEGTATKPRTKTAAPGGAQKRATTPGAGSAPGYAELLGRQSRRPRSRFAPCNLVTEARAQAIVGAPMQAPLEAPQGPTCIYRTRTGGRFITLAVQNTPVRALRPRLRHARELVVSGRPAYCAGGSTLFVPLARSRVLAVAAPCSLARRFAAEAVMRLRS